MTDYTHITADGFTILALGTDAFTGAIKALATDNNGRYMVCRKYNLASGRWGGADYFEGPHNALNKARATAEFYNGWYSEVIRN